jgi:hypothetical protein
MARMLGTSGAWQGIIDLLAEIGLRVERPGEIPVLLEEQKLQLGQKMAEAQKNIEQALAPVSEAIRLEKENIQNAPAERLAELDEDLRQIKLHLELFRLDRSLFGRASNLFRIRRQEKKLASQEQARSEITGRMKRLLDAQDQILAEKRAAIESEAISQYREINTKVSTLQKVLDSKELATATLELELIEHLETLPEQAWVINGVHLEAEQAVRFEGKAFWAARIDHLVLTPSGLFAVEVQPGGKQNTAQNSDPYEQIRRAAHLCHEMLKADFPGLTVRAVLAHRGAMPESQQSTYVKSLGLGEVTGYINWFKDNSLSAEQVETIATYLQKIGSKA